MEKGMILTTLHVFAAYCYPELFFLLDSIWHLDALLEQGFLCRELRVCMYVEVQIFLRLPNRFHALLNWMITISYIVYHINGLIWSSISSWGDGKREREVDCKKKIEWIKWQCGTLAWPAKLALLGTCLIHRLWSCVLLGWHCCFFPNFHLSPILSFLNGYNKNQLMILTNLVLLLR